MLLNLIRVENKLNSFFNNSFVSLLVIGLITLFIRISLFPTNLPVTLDGITYFWYASDVSTLGHLPIEGHQFANNGWPILLSGFFSVSHSSNFFDLMNLQRALTVSLSVLTIIPVYLLCRKFFDKPYAFFGTALFAFEPRIIQNSFSGLTEPFYIILITTALVLFFNSNKKLNYVSFGIVGLASLVRAEGIFVFLPLIAMFFIRNRKESTVVIKSIVSVLIYVLVILPIALWRIKTLGTDELSGRIIQGTRDGLAASHDMGLLTFLTRGIENIVKLTGWSLVPIFIFFVPIGIFLILKKRNTNMITIIVIIGIMFLPVLYAFSFNPETRYIYPLYPLLCILSIFMIKEVREKIKNQNIFLALAIAGILLGSVIFLDIKEIDFGHQKEAFGIATHLVGMANGINEYYPESVYIQPAEMSKKWPSLKTSFVFNIKVITTSDYNSLIKYISESERNGLTHIVVDSNKNRPTFLTNVFYHEEKYPFLIKILDSSDLNYKYHVKIYKINYDKFHSIYNSDSNKSK